MSDASITSYPDVNHIVGILLEGAQASLGRHFVGMYLDGSLALDSFNDDSDIDFLIATTETVSPAQFDELYALHERIRLSRLRYSIDMEGSYIPLAYLRRHDPNAPEHPNLQRGSEERLCWQQHHSDWVIHRYILHEHGLVVTGPSLKTLIEPVSSAQLRDATRQLIQDWWQPMIQQPSRLDFDGYKAYAVVTMCRMLYTLAHGTVAPKPVAAQWAKSINGANWATLIERALRYHLSEDDLQPTLDLIAYTVTRSHDG
jgi:hypothetical protein